MSELIINSKIHGVKIVLLDEDDYEKLKNFKWYIVKGVNTFYVVRSVYLGENKCQIREYLHRVVMKEPKGMCVDHIDGDGLDNRKCNLRVATKIQNGANRKPKKTGSSKYLGVCVYSKKNGRRIYWTANIRVMKKLKWLGQFPYTDQGELEAAKMYDVAAKKYHGDFANLNFK